MALQGKPVAIGNTATTIYTCPGGTEAAVHGLIFANNTGGALTVDLAFYDQTTGTTVTVATDLSVAALSYITWSKPINMNAGDYIQATSSASSGLVCLFSAYEGSAAPVATGFTGRGVWSSASTYAVNDIVTVVGTGTYLALQASTNQNPTSATAYWMFLEGISASALPSQAGQTGKFLTTDGTDASWAVVDVAGGATSSLGNSSNITLTSASTRVQKISFTSGGYSVKLPSATSLTKGGELFAIENKGDFAFSLLTTNNLPVTSIAPGGLVQVYLLDNSTADGTWQINIGTAQGTFASASTLVVDDAIIVNRGDMIQIANDKFLCAYWESSTTNRTNLFLRVAQFSSGSWTLGTRTSITLTQALSGSNYSPQHAMAKLEDDKAIICFWDCVNSTPTFHNKAAIITVSGTTISVGSNVSINTGNNTSTWIPGDIAVMSSSNVVIGYSTYLSSTWGQNLRAATISGTSITLGSEQARGGSWPGCRVVRETSSLVTFWRTDANSYFPDQVEPWTVSGTTLTSGTSYTGLRYVPGTSWSSGPRFAYKDANTLYMAIRESGSATVYLLKYGRDTSSPPRWSNSSSHGFKQLSASNSLNSDSYTIRLYSTTGGVDKIAFVNYVSAGLGGAGMALSFYNYVSSSDILYQSSLSFLIGGESLNQFTVSSHGNPENCLQVNSAGDLYLAHRDFLTQKFNILKIGLAQV